MFAGFAALAGARGAFTLGGPIGLPAAAAEADGCAGGKGSAFAAAEFSAGGATGIGSRAGFADIRSPGLPFFTTGEEMFAVAGLCALSVDALPPKIENVPMTTLKIEKTTTPAAAPMAR
jgi:hypothetical protein